MIRERCENENHRRCSLDKLKCPCCGKELYDISFSDKALEEFVNAIKSHPDIIGNLIVAIFETMHYPEQAGEPLSADDAKELLAEMVEDGLLKFGEDRDGEPTYTLDKKGEGLAVEVLGGQDVVNVASALTSLLVDHRNALGGEVEDNIGTWAIMIRVAQIWKQFSVLPWRALVEKLEKEVLEPKGYFKRGMKKAFQE